MTNSLKTAFSRPKNLLTLLAGALIFFSLQACQPEPEEVVEASMTEGDTLSAKDEIEGQDVEVTTGGPAAWSCQRYLDLSDDTSAHYDLEAASQAEDYVDTLLDAAEAEETPSLVRPALPLRAALRDACSDRGTELFSTVANEAMAVEALL